jgi:antitoxin HicB
MNVLYPAIINFNRSDKRYNVRFPDLPEAITEGETLEEALANASEVLTLTLEGRIDEGMEIPRPSHRKKARLIAPSARAQAAFLLRWAKGKYTTAQIARSLKTSWPAVARLEDPRHWPNLRQLEKAAATLGHKLVISLEPLSKY